MLHNKGKQITSYKLNNNLLSIIVYSIVKHLYILIDVPTCKIGHFFAAAFAVSINAGTVKSSLDSLKDRACSNSAARTTKTFYSLFNSILTEEFLLLYTLFKRVYLYTLSF